MPPPSCLMTKSPIFFIISLMKSMLLTKQQKLTLIRSVFPRERYLSGDARGIVSLFLEIETMHDYDFLNELRSCLHIPARIGLEVCAVPKPERVLQLTLF